MNKWLRTHLVCPRDKKSLDVDKDTLICRENHFYPIIDDIPIMLVDDEEITHGYIAATLEKVAKIQTGETDPDDFQAFSRDNSGIDKFVQMEIPYTSGHLYLPIQNKLTRYPIPEIGLPEGKEKWLLDVGCNWGRWSIAASGKGYRTVGIEPGLDAVLAARRVSQQLHENIIFVVGDARFMPFETDSFDVVFSYSVLQHMSKQNVNIILDEIGRVLRTNGTILIQMPNKYGIRPLQQQWRRGFIEGEDFEVRYWKPKELMETFQSKFGKTKMTADCFFGLGIQGKDVDLLPFRYKIIVYISEILRSISRYIRPIIKVADSLYLESINQKKK